MIAPDALRQRARPIDRSADRRVALVAVVAATIFLVAAVASLLLPEGVRRGGWLPTHLALAGAATTAIAGVMPFFAAAFAAAAPADARLRVAAVAAVAGGALGIAIAVPAGRGMLAVLAGSTFIAGVGVTAAATLRPLRDALGPSRGLVIQGYLIALAEVALGALIATLFLAGWAPVVEAWSSIKPAHAWLNLVGFVSLVIATTLLHFFPTVIGARIVPHPSARLTVRGLAIGAPLVSVGFVVGSDLAARVGAAAVLAGGAGLVVNMIRAWVTRARWTTDLAWHRFAIGGLISAVVWLEVGMVVAAGRVLVLGADPSAWRLDAILGPLVVGWVGLSIVASATHLLPAIGPGDQAVHARQRARLGRWATPRLLLTNVGALILSAALALGAPPAMGVGTVALLLGLGWTAALLGSAAAMGLRARP
jgi:nitrite reductase (NO-forming)